ncbi:MAG: glycerophosphoryl diester phosphodiesterase membrane domain-containing protein [Cytophagales bacterium]|nr:glycerophosphoryl diester phosphodiesterase membrane domain-containing protein [Armatimonadota bacterium]
MEITRFADLRPRTVRDILDDAFDLYREKFALLAGVSAVAYVPVMLTALAVLIGPYAAFVKSASQDGTNSSNASFAFFLQFLGLTLLVLPLLTVAQIMQTGATCIVVEDRMTGRETTVGSAWRRMLQRIGPLLAGAVATGFLSLILGAVLSGIGTFLAITMTLYTAQSIVLEQQGSRSALRRSWSLASHAFGKTLGFVLLTNLLGFFLWIGLYALILLILNLLLPTQEANPAAQQSQVFALTLCILGISLLLVAPISGIGATLLYYDLRVRREGIDIQAAAEEMSYPLAPDPFGGIAANPEPRPASEGKQKVPVAPS